MKTTSRTRFEPRPTPPHSSGVAGAVVARSALAMLGAVVLATAANTASAERRAPSRAAMVDQRLVGQDYRSFQARSLDDCERACRVESQCRSWTYQYRLPRDVWPWGAGTCHLKAGVPRAEFAVDFTSGVKPPPPAVRADRNRPPPYVPGYSASAPLPPVVKR